MEVQTLSLLTLNTERSKHLDRILPFLGEKLPDVCCIQELCESDIPLFENILGAQCVFEPMVLYEEDGSLKVVGIGIFSRFPLEKTHVLYYVGERGVLRKYANKDQNLSSRMILAGQIEKDGKGFQIATTHFTWTPNGEADDVQRRDLTAMFNQLDTIGDFVLCGDFNAPRGREIFTVLSTKYTDNIPLEYTSSIDATFHRAKDLEYMIDGIFSTPCYAVRNVKIQSGLSDHCGFLGEVTRIEGEEPM